METLFLQIGAYCVYV